MVYLMLQHCKQSSIQNSGAKKLKPHYYGPSCVTRGVGEVAYEFDLPVDNKAHNVFHVSCLKKALGSHVFPSPILPRVDDEEKLELITEAILDTRERHLP